MTTPAMTAPAPSKTIHFVSLGCPKNRVDTEVMLGVSDQSGCQLVDDPAQAEVIVINTCGFIESAKQESIDDSLVPGANSAPARSTTSPAKSAASPSAAPSRSTWSVRTPSPTAATSAPAPTSAGSAKRLRRSKACAGCLFYLYPDALDDRLLDLYASGAGGGAGGGKLVPYVDMPFQHASDRMLKRMRRGYNGARQRSVVQRLRERVPDLSLRTAFIVGHPGETEADFDALCDFVRWAQFDHVGVFRYSHEDGTHSHTLDQPAPLP